MKKLFVVLFAVACGREVPQQDLKVTMQAALNDVTSAVRRDDFEAFKSVYLPAAGPDSEERMMRLTMNHDGFVAHYGDNVPQIVELREEGAGVISITIEDNPKRLFFWRDEHAKIWWTGLRAHRIESVNVVRQALNIQSQTYDIWNQSTITHTFNTTCDTSTALHCPMGVNSCVWSSMAPVTAGTATTITANANVSGSNWAVARIDPANVSCRCTATCCPSLPAGTSTVPTSCCWVNAWGWDFWWTGSDTNPANGPTCGNNSWCPT